MSLRIAVGALLLLLLAPLAHAQGVVTLRGNYWRDRNTRVLQPEVELAKELPSGTVVGTHYLLDAITSASQAAGTMSDQPFTELRNEAGFSVGQRIGPALLSGSYSYSSESDYWAHTASLGALVELFQKNTTLGLTLAYGNDRIGQRVSSIAYNPLGGLQTVRLLLTATQTLTSTLLATLSYELGILGFGTRDNGFLSNPYRAVYVGQTPQREEVPHQRIRESLAAGARWLVPLPSRLVPYLAFAPSLRIYWDDWGLVSETPELRLYVPLGALEWRLSGRYYNQNSVSFWSEVGGMPLYPDAQGRPCTGCRLAASHGALFFTSDPKLGAFTAEFLELRLLIKLRWLGAPGRAAAINWFAGGLVELAYGHYFNGGYAHTAFGDAEVAGLTLEWPF